MLKERAREKSMVDLNNNLSDAAKGGDARVEKESKKFLEKYIKTVTVDDRIEQYQLKEKLKKK